MTNLESNQLREEVSRHNLELDNDYEILTSDSDILGTLEKLGVIYEESDRRLPNDNVAITYKYSFLGKKSTFSIVSFYDGGIAVTGDRGIGLLNETVTPIEIKKILHLDKWRDEYLREYGMNLGYEKVKVISDSKRNQQRELLGNQKELVKKVEKKLLEDGYVEKVPDKEEFSQGFAQGDVISMYGKGSRNLYVVAIDNYSLSIIEKDSRGVLNIYSIKDFI